VIRSPIDGMVISRSVDVGQTVAASLQAPTLFTIAENLVKMQVHTSIDEGDIGKVRAGQDALFTVSAYPGERFTGKVVQVRNEPKTEQNVVTYDTILSADNPDLKLKPGMTATVSIIIDKREGVKKVLNAALSFKPESVTPNPRKVWILNEGGELQPIGVEVGITDGTYTEIKGDSLQEGQEVILGLEGPRKDSQPGPRPPTFGRPF